MNRHVRNIVLFTLLVVMVCCTCALAGAYPEPHETQYLAVKNVLPPATLSAGFSPASGAQNSSKNLNTKSIVTAAVDNTVTVTPLDEEPSGRTLDELLAALSEVGSFISIKSDRAGMSALELISSESTIGAAKRKLETDLLRLDAYRFMVTAIADGLTGLGYGDTNFIAMCAGLVSEAQTASEALSAAREEIQALFGDSYDESSFDYEGDFWLTGYCPCYQCCNKSESNPAYGYCACGVKAVDGVTVAADGRYPFGTVLYIEGVGVRTVQDRGGAIKGNKLDIYCDTHAKALAGDYCRYAQVYVIA